MLKVIIVYMSWQKLGMIYFLFLSLLMQTSHKNLIQSSALRQDLGGYIFTSLCMENDFFTKHYQIISNRYLNIVKMLNTSINLSLQK